MPRKNILSFMGRPIIHYTIEAAKDCGLFDRIIVSTEDEEIAKVVRDTNAEVLARPPGLATDDSTVVEVCLHVLDWLWQDGFVPDFLCCLYATAPMRTAEDIKNSFELMLSKNATSVMAVTHYPIPAWWAMKQDEHGHLSFVWPEFMEKCEKEIPEMVVDNGSTYWAQTKIFLKEKSFYTSRLAGYAMPFERSIDIDTPTDLKLATYLASIIEKES